MVDRHQVWDTQLLHRLLALGTVGDTARGKGESTLEACTSKYLNVDLPKDVKDSAGHVIRLSYWKWLKRPPVEIEPVYLSYLCKDVLATFWVFQELISRLHELMLGSHEVWGHVSQEWLLDQIKRWGYSTHHIQLKAAIVLREPPSGGPPHTPRCGFAHFIGPVHQ